MFICCVICTVYAKFARNNRYMAEHNDLGRDGEEAAARYLMFHDYSILDRNWRAGNLEIDIVAQKKGVLVFVEVKTQETDVFLEPEDRVGYEKRRRLVRAANAYIRFHDIDQQIRFDVISVVGHGRPFSIRHIENAFDANSDTLHNGF